MLSLLPRHSNGEISSLFSHRHISLPRTGGRVGLCNVLFEDCSAFTHVTACTLAGSPNVTRYIKGFSYFVTSITAPIASGWSDNRRVGFSPTGKRRLFTAHARSSHLLLSNFGRINSFAIDKTRAHCANNSRPATEPQPYSQAHEWFDTRTMTCHQILYANRVQSLCCP